VAGKISPSLKGRYTADDAVRVLLGPSGLQATPVGDALVVKDVSSGEPRGADDAAQRAAVSEVVVTASHIQGAPPAAPVKTVDRLEILRSGYGDIGDVMRSLPETYSGGQNPGVQSGANLGNAGNQNQTNGSTVNLRGLGSDATLVLIDGQRLAADAEFQAADISVIPLGAIERVDIVADGASAIYGSDAVAGVANFIMRSDYDGAEFSQRIGSATEGGGFSQTYAGLAGKTWDGGHALISAQYVHQDPITAAQRDYTRGSPSMGNALLQAENQASIFVNAGQTLAPWVGAHLDGLYAQRRTGYSDEYDIGGTTYIDGTGVRSYFVAPGLTFTLPRDWNARLDGSASGTNDDSVINFSRGRDLSFVSNSTDQVEASANGPVFSLPGGAVKLAIGGGYRTERFGLIQQPGTNAIGSRSVAYGFAEVFAPLVAPSPTRLGLEALDLSLAGRWEHYSDFGSTANPKVGVRYTPIEGVVLRGTWGTSFKAPQFLQTRFAGELFEYPAAALGGSPPGNALLSYGGNPDLAPERSKSWTAGVDWTPPFVSDFKASLTYFNIDYTDRIVQPITSVGTVLAGSVTSPFVIANPTPAQQAAAVARANLFANLTGAAYDPANVVDLIEDRFVNAAIQKIQGVDVSIKKGLSYAGNDFDGFVDASWLHITQQTYAGAPPQTLTGTLFNPPNWHLRSGLTWTRGSVSATGAVNYLSGEIDTGVSPHVPISAWTTVDLNVSYKVPALAPHLKNLEASVSVTNAFDAKPPFARGAATEAPGLNYDSTNASAIGRFVAFTLRERF
jgi:outer membrane receptor protein involved in Fe transport